MSAELKYFRLHRNFFKLTGRRDCHSTVVSQYGTHLYKSTLCLNQSKTNVRSKTNVLMVFSQISDDALINLYFSLICRLFIPDYCFQETFHLDLRNLNQTSEMVSANKITTASCLSGFPLYCIEKKVSIFSRSCL